MLIDKIVSTTSRLYIEVIHGPLLCLDKRDWRSDELGLHGNFGPLYVHDYDHEVQDRCLSPTCTKKDGIKEDVIEITACLPHRKAAQPRVLDEAPLGCEGLSVVERDHD